MENNAEKMEEQIPGFKKLILKESSIVTVLDLSSNNLTNVDNINFPSNLIELNLSNNKLDCISTTLLSLKKIKKLDLSYNKIEFFDETPAFCHTIEKLNLSNNELCGPPYWVWSKYPENLRELDISCNRKLMKSLTQDNFTDILQHNTLLNVVKIHSSGISSHYELLGTFVNVKMLDLSSEFKITANCFYNIPCQGLDKCINVENLNLSHTYLSSIKSNIDIYQHLIEINLSQNIISDLPNEFCNLINLEVCILSINNIMYLPDNIVKLKKLKVFCVDSNKLCMLPNNMHELKNLIKLDLYDNYIYDSPDSLDRLQELDLAQNYLDEPVDEEYKMKKQLLRLGTETRFDGRKFEIERPESAQSSKSLDEELADIDYSKTIEHVSDGTSIPPSSPEDWDSDEYWVPHFLRTSSPPRSPWLFFVKQKMAEGNFCPMDAHTVPVLDKVRYEKLCKPYILPEYDGQFDDYSSDDS